MFPRYFLVTVVAALLFASCSEHPTSRTAAATVNTTLQSDEIAGDTFSIITACLFSEISYCNKPEASLQQYLPKWKIVWKPVYTNSNHAFVAFDGKRYAVAIRGSLMTFTWDALDNWVFQDMNVAVQKDWPYCEEKGARISQGAYRGWDNLVRMKDSTTGLSLLDFLLQKTKDAPVIFTGHSLGGNLATVFAGYYVSQLKKVGKKSSHVNVITFAAPAAGNEVFATAFDKQFPSSLRIENEGDIVAKFPCAERLTGLGALYTGYPAASAITVGYKDIQMPLNKALESMTVALKLLEVKNGFSTFTQTNGNGTLIKVTPSGRYKQNTVQAWFSEAGYQHGIAQYAAALGAPKVVCAD